MTPVFTQKKINTEEKAGEQLRQARACLNLSIEQTSKKTGIKQEYLIAMENEDFSSLPPGLYGKNFVKNYAKFLKLNHNDILKKTPFIEKKENNNPFSKQVINKKKFLVFPKIIKNSIIILVIIIFFSYLLFYLLKAREMPKLEIYEPKNNITIEENIIKISGKTSPEANLSINGKTIFLENNGFFSTKIDLKKGINQITIISQKRYSQENIIEKQILVQ